MTVNRVYIVRRGPVHRRLRVKIDGKTYTCGQSVRCASGAAFYIHAIHASGLVEFRTSHGLGFSIETKGVSHGQSSIG
jgi:hypothetical protein